jgi:hypothetical protein
MRWSYELNIISVLYNQQTKCTQAKKKQLGFNKLS